MAWIEQRRRADGGLTARVFWRPGGCRDTPREWETFGAGSDAQNLARADGFKPPVSRSTRQAAATVCDDATSRSTQVCGIGMPT